MLEIIRVELTFYSDYSMRVLMYLGLREGRVCQVSEIAAAYGISHNHLLKVVHGLAGGGFVHTFRGKGGGLTLARAPGKINLGRVVRAAEGPIRLVECMRGADNHCVITGVCSLKGILRQATENFLATLDQYTLADLLSHKTQLAHRLIH